MARLKFTNPTTGKQRYTYVKVKAFNYSLILNALLLTYLVYLWLA